MLRHGRAFLLKIICSGMKERLVPQYKKQEHGVFPLDKRSRFHYNENENREATRGESETEKETLCP